MPAKICPGAGLHRGGFDKEQNHTTPSKHGALRAVQALGYNIHNDMDVVPSRRALLCRTESYSPECRETGTPIRRTKAETLQGLPLSGRGADIGNVCRRRHRGVQEPMSTAASRWNEDKVVLDKISIDHQ